MRTSLIKIFFPLWMMIILTSCDLGSNRSSRFGQPDYSDINKENRSRDVWQKPSVVLGYLGDISDKVVADIGAGTGYFTFRLGLNAKKVIAIEIDPDMIDLIEAFKINLPKELEAKIETRLATPKTSNLLPNEANIIVMINTITYIEDKFSYLRDLYALLPDEGMIMIVDYKKNAPASLEHGKYDIEAESLQSLMSNVGFDSIMINSEDLEYQYTAIGIK